MTLSASRNDRPLLPARGRDHPEPRRPGPSPWPDPSQSPRTGPSRLHSSRRHINQGWSGSAGWAEPSRWTADGAVGLAPQHGALARRLAGHLLLAALPLLAISAHVFDLVPMHLTAGLVVIPLLVVIVVASLWRPLEQDRMLLRAAIVGAIATAVYDIIRLDTVYLLGWWGDFIPSIGAWILNTDDPATGLVDQPGLAEVLVGYIWRYAADGAGIGVWFYVVAAALRLRDRGPAITIGAAVAFAVAPVWAGLIGTVGLAPRAAELMFPLTARTLALSLLGHLIFGLVLGIGAARADRLDRLWPWPRTPIPGFDAALDWVQGAVPGGPDGALGRGTVRRERAPVPGGWTAAVRSASPGLATRPGEVTHLMPPTIEPRTGRAELTDLVAPVHEPLPPVALRATPAPVPSVRALPKSAATETGWPDQSRSGPVSRPLPCRPRARAPIFGPVPLPASPPARHPHPPAKRTDPSTGPPSDLRADLREASQSAPRPGRGDGPPVAWGRLSHLTSAEAAEAAGARAQR